MASFISKLLGIKTPKPVIPPPPPPPPRPDTTPSDEALRFQKRRKGRADTILAGPLVPEDVGTKKLLG